ncbi:spore germination lipoprotein GerD [Alkalibacillus silvisoli]|uniref:Spore germination protein GerD n=1 Tax=Alkalibacillus silvisoli TaxID=392823 RepID=A0ABP3K2F8_9BACI
MMVKQTVLLVLTICLFLVGCNGNNQQSESPDYEATKRMVVDILKTDDGKEALKETLSDEELKQELVLQSEEVNQAMERIFNSDDGKDFWMDMFEDPSFVQAYVQATREQDQELIKGLMSDSAYQEQMISLFHNEEVQNLIRQALRSQEYKGHLEDTIRETLESPVFKTKITESLIKAAEELDTSQGQEQGDEESANEEQNNGQSQAEEGQEEEGEQMQ